MVPKFMMVTFKLLGDKIVCEDKQKVSFIDPKTMQPIASISTPDEGCYLTAAYRDYATNTILLGFDNKKLIGVDCNQYNVKTVTTLKVQCMKFTEFHGDPKNYVILACEKGTLIIYKPVRNLIIASFDMEQAILDELRNNGEQVDEDNYDMQVGDIVDVIKTKSVDDPNEYMVLSKEGMFFVSIKEVKKPGNPQS